MKDSDLFLFVMFAYFAVALVLSSIIFAVAMLLK